MEHFYHLEGKAKIAEDFFYAPYYQASQLLDDVSQSDYDLFTRVGKCAAGIFIGLISLPFSAVGWGINRLYREKINSNTYDMELKDWKKIIITYNQTNPQSDYYQEKEVEYKQVTIINELIKSRVLASQSKFQSILVANLLKDAGVRVLSSDGIYPHFKQNIINNAKSCLVTAFASRQTMELNPARYGEISRQSNEISKSKVFFEQFIKPDLKDVSTLPSVSTLLSVCWFELKINNELPEHLIKMITTGT